jgi:hypothetical protein
MLLLCCGIPVAKLTWNYYHQYVISNNQHALLCETLQPGMSVSEVSNILKETGHVIIEMRDGNSQYAHYSILFTDKNVQDLYAGWTELIFEEGKYSGAYIEGFELESIDVICDFSQATKSATATSRP